MANNKHRAGQVTEKRSPPLTADEDMVLRLEARCTQLSQELGDVRRLLRTRAYANPIYQAVGTRDPQRVELEDVFDEPFGRPAVKRMIRDVERHLDSADELIASANASKTSLHEEVRDLRHRLAAVERAIKLFLDHLPSAMKDAVGEAAAPMPIETAEEVESAAPPEVGPARSLYDLVKIKIWLSEPGGRIPGSHYYVLSRYMLARSLQAASIGYSSAIKASLLLKRHLVDNSILSLDQETLERTLFDIILSNALATPQELETWSMVTRFQQSRTPLVILMSGTSCQAKTRVAHALSSRLHFNYVILTGALRDMMFPEEKEADDLYLFRSVQNDVAKAFKDGKSIIIEGDLEQYIDRFVHGAYDEDVVPLDTITAGLVTVLQDQSNMSPVLVNVRDTRERGEAGVGASNGEGRDERNDHPALVVPLVLQRDGDDRPPPRDFFSAGMIPVFELDENASPEDNSDEIHGWILKAIGASELRRRKNSLSPTLVE